MIKNKRRIKWGKKPKNFNALNAEKYMIIMFLNAKIHYAKE